MKQLTGGTITGFKYGLLTPKDYSGLKLWLRSSDEITFYKSNAVSTWGDLSGNANNLSVLPGINSAGSIVNTSMGPAYYGTNATNPLSCINTPMHKFLMDGSPYTIITLIRVLDNTNTGVAALFTATNNPRFASSVGTGISHALVDVNGSSIMNAQVSNANFINGNNYVLSYVNYGYNSGVSPLVTTAVNENILGSSSAYSTSPVNITPTGPFTVFQTTKRYLYEVIIYNNTGKSKALIDLEATNIVNLYLKKRYSNLY